MAPDIHTKVSDHFAQCPTRHYSKGSVIIQAGQKPDGVYYLKDGVVEQYDVTYEGNKVVVNVFKPPAFFPLSWAINKTPNTYSFAALTDAELQYDNADSVVAFLKANPDVLFDLMSRVYRGTDALLKRLTIAAGGLASARLIFELLIEANRFAESTDNTWARIKIKQHTLASRSGLARETVSRELHKLEKDGLIAFDKGFLSLDTKRLEEKLDITI